MPRQTGGRQGRALAADSPVGIGDSAVFFAPAGCGQQHCGQFGGVGAGKHVADHGEITARNRGAHIIGLRHTGGGVGADDPQRLDPFIGHSAEHIDRFQPRPVSDGGGVPEGLDGGAMGRIFNLQMAGQHIGQPANLPPAHGVGLAGYRKWPHPGPADPPGGQMAIDDRVHLVGAAAGLVHPLGKYRDDLFRAGPQPDKPGKIGRGQAGTRHIIRPGGGQGRIQPGDVIGSKGADVPAVGDGHQQVVEQRHIRPRGQRQVQIGKVRCGGAARVDVDDFHRRAGGFGGHDPLEQHRVAPGQVAAHQHHQIGLFQIVIGARHGIGAKRAPMPRHGRGHAKP